MRIPKDEAVGITATNLVTGERQRSYGDPLINYEQFAILLSALFGVPVTRRQAVHVMILLKLVRDFNVPGRDNEVDICGYATILQLEREDDSYAS